MATLGGRVALVGVIGDDAAGAEVTRLLAASPGILAHLVVAAARATTAKYTLYGRRTTEPLRLDEETTAPIDELTCVA